MRLRELGRLQPGRRELPADRGLIVERRLVRESRQRATALTIISRLHSDDDETLAKLGTAVSAAIERVPGVVDVAIGTRPAGDALTIHVDQARAAIEGLAPGEVTATCG